jgi:hypothetical protein
MGQNGIEIGVKAGSNEISGANPAFRDPPTS